MLRLWWTVPWYVKANVIGLLALIAIGTIGYIAVERWTFHDALYMTVITMTTIGYREVRPLTLQGQWFTIMFIFASVTFYIYAASSTASYLLSDAFRRQVQQIRTRRKVQRMENHIIVCGYGRIGSQIVQELALAGEPFVIVERDPKTVRELQDLGYAVVVGDATQEETLLEAGVERARALIATAATDADNAFIALTARSLNPKLFIVSRVSDPALEPHLRRAGANRALSPYRIGALRMAGMVIRPHVHEFIEIAVGRGTVELQMEEIHIPPESPFAGRSLAECEIRQRYGVLVIGMVRPGEGLTFNPDPQQAIPPGTILMVIGRAEEVERLRQAAEAVRVGD